MSFQITILKVLAGHPGGQASLAELRSSVAILMTSGREWIDRTKTLAARAPGLDIFSQALVTRGVEGWRITEAGRILLKSIENGRETVKAPDVEPAIKPAEAAEAVCIPRNVIQLVDHEITRRRRAAA